jgi:hypothetical protein
MSIIVSIGRHRRGCRGIAPGGSKTSATCSNASSKSNPPSCYPKSLPRDNALTCNKSLPQESDFP